MDVIFDCKANFEDKFIKDYQKLSELSKSLKKEGRKVVLLSGSFDLFHVGHARYLEKAKSLGDILIVGIDSDDKVRVRKGPKRPVVPESERLEMLSHTKYVDIVTLKSVDDPKLHLLKTVRPSVLVISKSTGHTDEKIQEMEEYCLEVVALEPQAKTSTTAKIRILLIGGAEDLVKRFVSEAENIGQKILEELKGKNQ